MENKSFYRKKIILKENGIYYDEISGINISISYFRSYKLNQLQSDIEVKLRISFAKEKNYKYDNFYLTGISPIGKYWTDDNFKVFITECNFQNFTINSFQKQIERRMNNNLFMSNNI